MNACTLMLLILAMRAGPLDAGKDSPFDHTAFAPPDVRLYLHVSDAARLRAEIADRPLAEGIDLLLEQSEFRDAWRALARASGVDESGLFDICLGRQFTLMLRNREPLAEWAVIAEVDPAQAALIVKTLRPIVHGPRLHASISELPEHEMLLARNGRLLLIGPSHRRGLFDDMLPSLTGPLPESLAEAEALADAAQLGSGQLGAFMRHDPPLGGWSAAVASINGDSVKLRYLGRYDHAPFSKPITSRQWNVAPIHSLNDSQLVAVMQPLDAGESRFETFLSAVLGTSLSSGAFQDNIGDRKIFVIGEQDGRLQEPSADLLYPTFALVYEVRDPFRAWFQMDEEMIGAIGHLNRLGAGTFHVASPARRSLRTGQVRHVPLSDDTAGWLLGDVAKGMEISLNWGVVDAPETGWCIVASHPQLFDDLSEAMSQGVDAAPDFDRRAGFGIINGQRLSTHLANWSEQSHLLARPAREGEVSRSLEVMAGVAQGVDRCSWDLKRPTTETVQLEVTLQLTPPHSTRTHSATSRETKKNP